MDCKPLLIGISLLRSKRQQYIEMIQSKRFIIPQNPSNSVSDSERVCYGTRRRALGTVSELMITAKVLWEASLGLVGSHCD